MTEMTPISTRPIPGARNEIVKLLLRHTKT